MHRLFVAIRPPRPIRDRLMELMGGVAGARWQTGEQLHITLRFIGEVDRHVVGDLETALAAVRQAPFDIRVDGIGAFERRGRPEAIWAGLAPHEDLRMLHKKVDQACMRAGVAAEGRAYHPHITLARLNRSSGGIAGIAEVSAAATSLPFRVDSFGLFESILAPEGAAYTMVQRYRLV